MIKRKNKNRVKKFIPVLISGIIFVLLCCGIAYMLSTSSLLNDKESTTTTTNKTTIKVESMQNDIQLSCNQNDSKKLKEAANKITFDFAKKETRYECDDETVCASYTREIEVTIKNIPENVYVKLNNFSTEDVFEKKVTYQDTQNGEYKFISPNFSNPEEVYVTVYSLNESCKDEIVRKLSIMIPVFNYYRDTMICNIEAIKDFEHCSEFTIEKVSSSKFKLDLKEYVKKNNIEDKLVDSFLK